MIPTEVLSYEEDRAVADKDGEVTGTEKVLVDPAYYWLIERGEAKFYIRQQVNPWAYQQDTEGMSEAQLAPFATLSKVCSKTGAKKYAGESPKAVCNIPQYLFAEWQKARVMYPLAAADAVKVDGPTLDVLTRDIQL